jgi:hypothetical protein
MKKIIFILLLLSTNLAAKNPDYPRIKVKIKIARNNNITGQEGRQNLRGFITGVLFNSEPIKLIGSDEAVDIGFLKEFSDQYAERQDHPENINDKAVDTSSYLTSYSLRKNIYDADRILNYSFYPIEILPGDSLLRIYCKYILYQKKSEINANKNNYDVSYCERFYTVPLNKRTKLDFLTKIFPEATTNEISFFKDAADKKPLPSLYLNDGISSGNELSLKDIAKSVRKDSANANMNIHINAEYLRFNKNGDSLFVKKKINCLPETNRVYSDYNTGYDYADFYANHSNAEIGGDEGFMLDIYKGSMTLPFQMYSPSKKRLFVESKYKDSDVIYSVTAIPLNRIGNKFVFNLVFKQHIWEGSTEYSKKIEIETGKPLRIDLEAISGLWRTEKLKNGQVLNLSLGDDYSHYIKECLVLEVVEGK